MSLLDRLFSEEVKALEPRRGQLQIMKKFELGGSKPNPGPMEPRPLTARMSGASARPVATGKLGHVFGSKPSNRISQKFSEELRARFEKIFTELDAKSVYGQPPKPSKPSVKPEASKPTDDKQPTDAPKPTTGPYKLGTQNAKTIPQHSYSEALSFIDTVVQEAKKHRGFVSQEISHLMHGHASKGPLKGKHVPQKQAVAIALNVARRKGIKV